MSAAITMSVLFVLVMVPLFLGLTTMYPPLDSIWPASLCVAAVVSAIALVVVRLGKQPKVRARLRSRIGKQILLVALAVVASVGWVPWLNGQFDYSNRRDIVVGKKVSRQATRGTHAFVVIDLADGKHEARLDYRHSEKQYWMISDGQQVNVAVRPGLVGIRWVESVR